MRNHAKTTMMPLLAVVLSACCGGTNLWRDSSNYAANPDHGSVVRQISVSLVPASTAGVAEAAKRANSWSVIGNPVAVVDPLSDPVVPTMLLTPYGVRQLRAGCSDGVSIQFFNELIGQTASTFSFTFSGASETEVNYELRAVSIDGTETTPVTQRTQWEMLRRHAHMQASTTSVARVMTRGPLGTHECFVYTELSFEPQSADAKSSPTTPGKTVTYFAVDLPGPPLRQEKWVNDKITSVLTQIARTSPTKQ